MDAARKVVSDPTYQSESVRADSSREEAAAAAHPDSGAVAPRSAVTLCPDFKEGGQLMTTAGGRASYGSCKSLQ